MDQNTTIDDIFPSKWLKAADLGSTPMIVTISAVDFEQIGLNAEMRAVISFANATKRMILNKTNGAVLATLYGKKSATG